MNISNGKKHRSKHELTDIIITGSDNKSASINDNFTVEDANKILSKIKT